jgi:hypothetical protein
VAPQVPLMAVDEEPHQRGNVLPALAQGRHLDRENAETIVEICRPRVKGCREPQR